MTDIEEKYEPIIDVDEAGQVFHKKMEMTVNMYKIYLTDSVNESDKYSEMCNLLRDLKNTDSVTFYLANYGGSCHGCVNLISAIRECESIVHMCVTAPCYSAGATLSLCGDSLTMYPHSFLMFHNYSAAAIGKGHELKLDTEHTRRWIHGYFEEVHRPFLTKTEHRKITEDRDLYIHWDDSTLQARIERHFKNRHQGAEIKMRVS